MIKLRNLKKVNSQEFDEIWVICRSVKLCNNFIQNNDNVYHVPELSPENSLFYWYLNQKKAGNWNPESFQAGYVPAFIKSLNNPQAQARLQELLFKSRNKDIALVCFCPDETMCHRSIVGGILLNMGADIECNSDYAKYDI
jgi:uncharacterized protein (DUF488 family)